MRRPIISLLIALCLLASPSAHAEEGELALALGPGLWLSRVTVSGTEVVSVAPTAAASLRYGLDDFWQIGGAVATGLALSKDHDPAFVGHAHLEAYLYIDVITWVLYAVAGVGALVRQAHADSIAGQSEGSRVDLSGQLGLGLDYRPARSWSVGGALRTQLVLSDLSRTAPAIDLTLNYTLYFD